MTEIFATGIQMGESPRWHDGRFWMCDWLAGEVLAFDADGRPRGRRARRRAAVLDRLAARRPARGDHAAAGWSRGPDLAPYGAAGQPFNEIVVDAAGQAWVDMPGSMPWEERKPGIVAVVLPDGTQPPGGRRRVVPQRHGDPRRRHAGRRRVARRPADRLDDHRRRRRSTDRRVWAELGAGSAPDGICVDAEGAIWYASVPGQRCTRVAEGGEVLRDDRGRPRLLLVHARRRRRPDAVHRRQPLRPGAPPTGSCSPTGRRAAGGRP